MVGRSRPRIAAVDVPVLAGLAADGSADLATADRAARAWRAGGLVALPTETVYGLAADAQNPRAVAAIYRVKGRPADHPLIVHVADRAALASWSSGDDAHAQVLARVFWPGPLTVVVARSARAGDHVTGGQDTVALRCPGHPVALACLRAFTALTGDPASGVAAPSANRFGRVSPTRASDVLAELGDRLDPRRDLVVDGGSSQVGLESTIVDCTGAWPRVLRPGAIGLPQIDDALARAGLAAPAARAPDQAPSRSAEPRLGPDANDPVSRTGPDPGVAGAADPAAPRAPGMLEAHYAPAAAVIVRAPGASPEGAGVPVAGLIALAGVETPPGWTRLAAPRTVEAYAHVLYAALRRADELGLPVVVAVLPAAALGPLADAVRDRVRRASHGGAGA